jgi:SAM-dependent methyltransferase
MHRAVFRTFEEICRSYPIRGSVLEIGATPDTSSLLNLPALAGASEKIGINKAGTGRFRDFFIHEADANAMSQFPVQRFDAILCNAVLEHDRFFWKTLGEIRRVIKRGGLLVIGAPGFRQLPFETTLRHWLAKLPRSARRPDGWAVQHSTLTLGVHDFPGDYYRFSEQAFREVILEGMRDVVIRTVLVPPRIIGAGIRS